MCLPVVSLFCHPRNHSFGRAEQADTVSKDCSRKITKKKLGGTGDGALSL